MSLYAQQNGAAKEPPEHLYDLDARSADFRTCPCFLKAQNELAQPEEKKEVKTNCQAAESQAPHAQWTSIIEQTYSKRSQK